MSTLLVIGVGLIGGSFALAARRAQCFDRVVGADTSAATLDEAQRRGIIDHGTSAVADALEDADAVFVAVPTASASTALAEVFRIGVGPGQVVFDGTSVKAPVIAALRRISGRLPSNYVPAHPMAGSERHGPGAASAELFTGCQVFLTAEPETDPAALRRVTGYWQAVGARVLEADAGHHDAMVALTSHLPHLVAFAYMRVLAERDELDRPATLSDFAGPGFRDFSRIAGSDAAIWRQIFEANREALGAPLTALGGVLSRFGGHLASGRFDELEAELDAARRTWRTLQRVADSDAGGPE